MVCEGFPAETYGLYILGSLSEEEREQIAAHLSANCETCGAEVAQYRRLWARVGATASLAEPPRRLRARVIHSVGGRSHWWSLPLPLLAGAAASLCMAVVGGWMLAERQRPDLKIAFSPVYRMEISAPDATAPKTETRVQTEVREVIKEVPVPVVREVVKTVSDPQQTAAMATLNQDLLRERQRAAQLESDLQKVKTADPQTASAPLAARTQELERQVTQYRALLETERKRADQSMLLAGMVTDPALRVVKLRATEKDRQVEGHALIAGNSRMMFYASQLPALPDHRVYQLWLIRANGQAIASAGLLTPDNASRGALQLRDAGLLSGLTTLALTDEPAGGSAQPTGHKWLIGS